MPSKLGSTNWGHEVLLAAVYSAFDRPTYQELIPRHLKDLLTMPSNVLHHLQKRSFSVCLSPTEWHGVALDECRGMKVNMDAKLAICRMKWHAIRKDSILVLVGCITASLASLFNFIS